MKTIEIHILETETRTIRITYDDVYDNEFGEPELFKWVTGNYACDCARRNEFQKANGEDIDEIECSNYLYSINIYYNDTLIYSEF